MSKTLLIYHDEHLLDYFKTLINAYLETEVVAFQNALDAHKYLAEHGPHVALVMVDFGANGSQDLISSILSREKALPCIITADSEDLSKAKKRFKTQTLLDYFHHYDNSDLLWKKIEKMVALSNRTNNERKYCKVNINFFYSTKEVFCDVYLKISDDKYVKVFNRYDQVDMIDLKKYDKRNIKYLYVRERDFGLITKNLVRSLKPLTESNNALEVIQNENLNMVFSIQLQETVSETVQKIGLNAEAVEMTSIAIDATMGLIERNEEVFDILNGSIKGENYSSEHSFLLAFLSGALLKESPYASHKNALCLSLAAFFHDVTIENSELAKIQKTSEYKFKTLGYKEQEEYIKHPLKARALVERIEGIPFETFAIIENHHENYYGTGFPQGLDYKRLSPLSCIFNLAHELTLYIYESGGSKDNIHQILDEFITLYPNGNYKMAVEAAIKVFKRQSPLCGESKKAS